MPNRFYLLSQILLHLLKQIVYIFWSICFGCLILCHLNGWWNGTFLFTWDFLLFRRRFCAYAIHGTTTKTMKYTLIVFTCSLCSATFSFGLFRVCVCANCFCFSRFWPNNFARKMLTAIGIWLWLHLATTSIAIVSSETFAWESKMKTRQTVNVAI